MRSRASAPPTPPKPSANDCPPVHGPMPHKIENLASQFFFPQALRQWLQATHPQGLAIGAPSPPRRARHHHTRKAKHKGKGRARDDKGHSDKKARRRPK